MGAALILSALAAVRVSRAGEPACDVMIVEEHGTTGAWHAAVDALRWEIASRSDCTPATLTVTVRENGARIVAITRDGRRAERQAVAPENLRAIALGLVASIPIERARSAIASALEPETRMVEPMLPAPAQRPPHELRRLTGAAMLGTRLGMPTSVLVAEAELRGDVFVDDWFLLVAARYAPLGVSLRAPRIRGYAYDEVALSIGAGRRTRVDSMTLDIALAPAIVVMTEEGDVPADGVGGTEADLRIDASARASFGHGRFKPALTLDAEIAPGLLARPSRVATELPSLPSWTLGLRAGITVDLL